MKVSDIWKYAKRHRGWLFLIIAIGVFGVYPRLTHIPTPVPFPKQYPLNKVGTFEEGARAYKEGKFGLALANFISSASHQSDVKSMSMAALMYYFGKGVQRDICQGTYWADMAARKGVFIDQDRLSRAYLGSYGIKMDIKKARLWAMAAFENKDRDKTNKWFKDLTGETVDPALMMNFLQDGLSQKEKDAYEVLYSNWNYKSEPPVKIIRTRHIPFIGMSEITPCSEDIQ